ncbi:MAG: 1,2-phenylacetyl-CoA epoxidase subunit B [Bacteroidetes bacterium]|nr:1,2-phenylacetyl-CoA epoxidase subunit B [Bacteroidota bacterium]
MRNTQDKPFPLWEVFVQAKSGTPHKHVGSVHAADKEMAMQNARDLYSRRSEGTSIWVVPADQITASSPEDQGAFFEPANDKAYRHPTFYTIPEDVKYL